MADLDSFFAKKDKKKVKGKKFTTTDEIARRLEETEEKLKHQGRILKPMAEPVTLRKTEENTEGGQEPPVPEPVLPPKKEEEEWNDFRDDSERDMTDLKISKLQIEDEEEYGGGSADDDGEKGEGGDKKDGVWKTEQAKAPQPDLQQPVEVELEDKNRLPGVVGSSYVPPHMRNMAPSPLPKNTPRRSRIAPDINNEMAFPSLSEAQVVNPTGAWGKKKPSNEGFENVKHGSTRTVQDDYAAPKLTTANRFDALSDNS